MTDPRTAAVPGPGGVTPPGPLHAAGPPAAPLPDSLAEAAHRLFGSRLDLALSFAELLATDGVLRGLVGPREAPRMWDRHMLNCAAVSELIPIGASVLDVGSGAGLPGMVLAVARPDLTVTLVEPLARRTAFLEEAVTHLGLAGAVTVLRARAEECAAGPHASGLIPADIVTARAVAPLDRLAGWCLPLVALGGRLLALKGASAAAEVASHAAAVGGLGGAPPVVRSCGAGLIDPPATVVEVVRERIVAPPRSRPPRGAVRSDRRSRGEGGSERGRARRG
ncbi:MAG TPA: 16S rRNA (guanine(527)-N(7))-methyltransferase RsmG [Pilimelia sp.]|nr:16S rRNA (guanine(527)-N(7))-methyltransferase RsmG [Pilimelia sp.]